MNIRSIFGKIFSVYDYNETRTCINICGCKIKFQKPQFSKLRKENPYYYYKNNNLDIRTVPKATGQLRDIQLANLAMFLEFDYVCRKNGLKYWLDFGTLLGAVRHDGFIPWDDDIDIGMPAEDYKKLIEIFDKETRNPDLYIGIFGVSLDGYLYKIMHKKCDKLFVDLFPYFYSGKVLTKDEQMEDTNRIRIQRSNFVKKHPNRTREEMVKNLGIIEKEIIPEQTENIKNTDLLRGIAHIGNPKESRYRSQSYMYPLTEIKFEGYSVMCPCSADEYLRNIFGNNYMGYPKKISLGHSAYMSLSSDEKTAIQNLIDGLKNE